MTSEQATEQLQAADLRKMSTWELGELVQVASDDTLWHIGLEDGRIAWRIYDQPSQEADNEREALLAAAHLIRGD